MKTPRSKSVTPLISWILLRTIGFFLLAASAMADLSVAYSGSAYQAVIVSFFDRHAEGNTLVGTLQIQNISGTWVHIEQDVTNPPNSVTLPYTIYLLGPDAIKTFPNFAFPQGTCLNLSVTTPLGLDFEHPSEKVTALQGALAVDLLTRGLLTFNLPPNTFDAPPFDAALGVIEPLLDELVSSVGGVEHLMVAVRNDSLTDTLSAISEIAADSSHVKTLLVELLRDDVTEQQVGNALGFIGEFLLLSP